MANEIWIRRIRRICGICSLLPAFWVLAAHERALGACEPCDSFQDGASLGKVTQTAVSEASGIAASRRNHGVLWTHNDGDHRRIYALTTNGTFLASWSVGQAVDDLEDIAVGPGPVPGVSYLYVGDIGASDETGQTRSQVRILRIPEPAVEFGWAQDPRSGTFGEVQFFHLSYPDAAYDAEALFVDPQTSDVFLVTKSTSSARVYRANLNTAANGATLPLGFVSTIPFGAVSAADMSPDGGSILIRREDYAAAWARCDGESVAESLSRASRPVPLVGPPTEPNGEGIAWLADGSGYVTISEGANPDVYFFTSLCPRIPVFLEPVQSVSAFIGATAELRGNATGYPAPTYTWRFKGSILPGQTGATLVIPSVTAASAGSYELIASNSAGSTASAAELSVRSKPDLRITEMQSSTSPSPNLPTADWWELTSFESLPVNLTGWRFNDNSGGLAESFVLPQVTISPRESIVFVEQLTPAQFRTWWGNTNLPPNLQVITYTGSGLSLSANGDSVRLWPSTAPVLNDPVAAVSFGQAQNGVSFNYDPITGIFGEISVLGRNGVIRAASSPDIASPGRIAAPAASPVLSVSQVQGSIRISFDATAGWRYSAEISAQLNPPSWFPTEASVFPTQSGPVTLSLPAPPESAFYRVRVE